MSYSEAVKIAEKRSLLSRQVHYICCLAGMFFVRETRIETAAVRGYTVSKVTPSGVVIYGRI